MSGLTAQFLVLSSYICFSALCEGSDVQQTHPGENVTLSCQVEAGVSIRAVEWTRDDLKGKEYVLFHRDGRSDPTNQHPSFKGRVELVDGELKDGNVSLILRNVSVNDNGTYECRVAVGRKKRSIIKTTPIRRIQLEVSVSVSGVAAGGSKTEEPTEGNHNHAGLVAELGLVCLAAVVVVVIVRKSKKPTNNQSEEPAAAGAVGDDGDLSTALGSGESCGSTHDPPPP